MKFADLQEQLNEYRSLPDDLTARLNFSPPPPMPKVCRECSENYSTFLMNWDDVAKELQLGYGDKEYVFTGLCPKHEPDDEDEDE